MGNPRIMKLKWDKKKECNWQGSNSWLDVIRKEVIGKWKEKKKTKGDHNSKKVTDS